MAFGLQSQPARVRAMQFMNCLSRRDVRPPAVVPVGTLCACVAGYRELPAGVASCQDLAGLVGPYTRLAEWRTRFWKTQGSRRERLAPPAQSAIGARRWRTRHGGATAVVAEHHRNAAPRCRESL